MLKLTCFSDTHATEIDPILPKGDVLIFCGDFSGMSTTFDVIEFDRFMGKQKHKHKLVVLGNHEKQCEQDWNLVNLMTNCKVLFDSSIVIKGVKFFGTSWQPEFNNWAFNRTEEELVELYKRIPNDTDVLISHCPPYGIVDMAHGEHLGSKALKERINQINPKLVICGHIHGGYGKVCTVGIPESTIPKTIYVNCSILDDDYREVNEPITIEI